MKKIILLSLFILLIGATIVSAETRVAQRLLGRILLQVEGKGEAYYVQPNTGELYYLRDGKACYDLMRNMSLGISNKDLALLPLAKDSADPENTPTSENCPTPTAVSQPVLAKEDNATCPVATPTTQIIYQDRIVYRDRNVEVCNNEPVVDEQKQQEISLTYEGKVDDGPSIPGTFYYLLNAVGDNFKVIAYEYNVEAYQGFLQHPQFCDGQAQFERGGRTLNCKSSGHSCESLKVSYQEQLNVVYPYQCRDNGYWGVSDDWNVKHSVASIIISGSNYRLYGHPTYLRLQGVTSGKIIEWNNL